MKRLTVALAIALTLPLLAQAAEVTLTGPQIRERLTGNRVTSVGGETPTTQTFYRSGETVYTSNGSASQGTWDVRGDFYCSMWEPSPEWRCYKVTDDAGIITFMSDDGVRYPVKVTGKI